MMTGCDGELQSITFTLNSNGADVKLFIEAAED